MIYERQTIHIQEITKTLLKARPIVVYLYDIPDGLWHDYHCSICKSKVTKWRGEILAEVPGDGIDDETIRGAKFFPFKTACPNKDCRRFYHFVGLVDV